MQSPGDPTSCNGRKPIFFLIWAVILFVAGCRATPAVPVVNTQSYSEAMYQHALENRSTSPSYVLISLREKGAERMVCIPGDFLLGAIHIEQHLDYGEQGEAKAFDMAMKQPERTFSFAESEALRNVQPRYTPEILEEVRALLAPKSDSYLWAEAGRSDGWLHRIYRSKEPFLRAAAYRDAVAHALLERSILVGIADITGAIYLVH